MRITLKEPGQRKNVPRKTAFERTLNPLKCILQLYERVNDIRLYNIRIALFTAAITKCTKLIPEQNL